MLGSAGCVGWLDGGSSGGGGSPPPTGSATSQLSASSTSVDFGNVTVGTSTSQLVTLTDTGSANVTISSVSATGSGFSASGASNVILTPNQSVTVSVNFSPPAAGGVTGKLSISSNASNSPVIGYFVYRGTSSNGTLSRLNASAQPSTSYTDRGVASGQTYLYAVRAVDSSYVESPYSNQVSVTIPSP
jgi:hypothetical protein